MKKNNTESQLRKAAENQMEEPPAFVWDNIEEQLHSKKSNRKIIFWWVGAGLLISTMLVVFMFWGDQKEQDIVKVNYSKVENETITSNHSIIENESSKEFDKNVNKIIITPQIDKVKNKSISDIEFEKNILEIQSSNDGVNFYTETQNTVSPNTFIENATISQPINILANSVTTSLTESTEDDPLILSADNKNRTTLDNTSIKNINLKTLNFSRPLISVNTCPEFNNTLNFKPFVEFGILGGIHNTNLKGDQNPLLFNLRNSTESTWYSTGVYGNIGFKIKRNWHLSIGAEWTMSKNKFENRKDGITKMIVTFDPSSGMATDTSFVSGTIFDKGDITFHYIDIPVNFGFSFKKNKWEYGAEFTGLFNITTSVEGKALSDQEGSIFNRQENIYRNSVGIGIRGSLILGRRINDRYTLQIRPSYKTYFNDLNVSNYDLPTRYHLYSISVGLRKVF